jgi:hypothetical protein
MERSIPVSRGCAIFILALVLLVVPPAARADHALVLIASADSPLTTVSSLDLRKLYLGFVVNSETGEQIHPITNTSDTRVKEIFLQNVVGMSARSYDRRLLTLTLQTGRHRPETYSDLDDLLNRVANDSLSIAFVWEEDAESRDDIKLLRVLWQR